MDSLWNQLQNYSTSGQIPFHMPGHKRHPTLTPYLQGLSAQMDITEIFGFDDLHDPEGILAEVQRRWARLYGSAESFLSINGSTGAILAGIRASTQRGDKVLLTRHCHKAVYHALELCQLEAVYLQAPLLPDLNAAGALPLETLAQALECHPDARLLVLVSPTYEGICSDVGGLVALAHETGLCVLVDEAHGAHLGLSDDFPTGAVQAGADLVVQSCHKTLPSLTQTAILHRQGTRVSHRELQRQMGIFQTSSPSYLLLASLDGCGRLLEDQGKALLQNWRENLAAFYGQVAGLKRLQVRCYWGQDPSKILIDTKGTTWTGFQLAERLRKDFQMELEVAFPDYAIAMTGLGEQRANLDALAGALMQLDALAEKAQVPQKHSQTTAQIPEMVYPLWRARELSWQLCPLEDCVGRISAIALWAYPPGIPLLVAGERISQKMLGQIQTLLQSESHIVAEGFDLRKGFPVLCNA